MQYLSNGQIIKRVDQQCPDNYIEKDSDMRICLPVFACIHRTSNRVETNCCVPYDQLHCKHFKESIEIVKCITCPQRNIEGNSPMGEDTTED